MIQNPHMLSSDVIECPKECPFLAERTFIPDTIPAYCNRYETFLGACPLARIKRCSHCRGVAESVAEVGVSLIEAYTVERRLIDETKQAFQKLNIAFQKMFVSLVSKTGIQLVLSDDDPKTPEALTDKLLMSWKKAKDKIGSPELKEFKSLLSAEGMPLMERQTQTLLMNLFMVLDVSEQEMLKNILSNPHLAETFLDGFTKQPQDHDLLKNVRALVYDYDRRKEYHLERMQQMRRDRHLERQRQQAYMRQQMRMRQLQKQRQKQRQLTR